MSPTGGGFTNWSVTGGLPVGTWTNVVTATFPSGVKTSAPVVMNVVAACGASTTTAAPTTLAPTTLPPVAPTITPAVPADVKVTPFLSGVFDWKASTSKPATSVRFLIDNGTMYLSQALTPVAGSNNMQWKWLGAVGPSAWHVTMEATFPSGEVKTSDVTTIVVG